MATHSCRVAAQNPIGSFGGVIIRLVSLPFTFHALPPASHEARRILSMGRNKTEIPCQRSDKDSSGRSAETILRKRGFPLELDNVCARGKNELTSAFFSLSDNAPLISFAPQMISQSCLIGHKMVVGCWLLVPIAEFLHSRTRQLKKDRQLRRQQKNPALT